MTVNEKLMMAGLFLSKFDKDGLRVLGFEGFWEAYNTLAFAVGAPPKSINNYRDEFDPYFPNPRKGWASRPLRPTRKKMMDELAGLRIDEFALLIRNNFSRDADIEELQFREEKSRKRSGSFDGSFAKRLMTGCAAENYFEQHYQEVECFKESAVVRTTQGGCGFDFKLTFPSHPFCAVEVKGLSAFSGSIQFTEKEHYVAETLQERYFLYVVRDFIRKPSVLVVQNPLNSDLKFDRKNETRVVTTWRSSISDETSSSYLSLV